MLVYLWCSHHVCDLHLFFPLLEAWWRALLITMQMLAGGLHR
jgi:hypothetical protein